MTLISTLFLIPILWLSPIVVICLFLPFHFMFGGIEAVKDLLDATREWYKPVNLKYFTVYTLVCIAVIGMFALTKEIILG